MNLNRVLLNILPPILFFLLSCFLTFPLIFHLTNLSNGYGDELLIAWNHSWDIYNFSFNITNLLHIFNANIYYPNLNTLAFSDTYFTNSLIVLIPSIFLKSPVAASNLITIISLTLAGFFTFKLCEDLTSNKLISFLSGTLIMFSPAYISELIHIQIISIFWLPLSLIFLIRFLKLQNFKFLVVFLACFVLQAYNSIMPMYFIVFAGFSIITFFISEKKNRLKVLLNKKNILLVILAFILILIIAIPYFQVSNQFGYVRDIRDTVHFALQPEDFLVAGDRSRMFYLLNNLNFTKDLHNLGEVKPAFLGLTFSILSLLAYLYMFKNFKKQSFAVRGLVLASIIGLLLSFGPFLHFQRLTIHKPFPIPLPYLLAYYILPGFEGFRNSARFEMMFVFLSSPIVAVALSQLLKKVKYTTSLFLITSLILLTILEFNFPIKYYPVPVPDKFPKIYSYLATTPKNTVVAFLPAFNWNVQPYVGTEIWREYYSTLNFRRMINGYSGFSPPSWQSLVDSLLANFPNGSSMERLINLGVNLIIVDTKTYDQMYKDNFDFQGNKMPSSEIVLKELNSNQKVAFISNVQGYYIYRIKR